MNIDKKYLYIGVLIVGLALVVGPVFGLRMKSEAEKYKRFNSEQEKKNAELAQLVVEMKGTLQKIRKEREQTVADLTQKQKHLLKQFNEAQGEKIKLNEIIQNHQNQAENLQKRIAGLTQSNHDLQQRNQTLVAEVGEVKTHTQELVAGKTQLTDQLRQIESEAQKLAQAKKEREDAVRNQQKLIASLKDEIAAGQVKIAEFAGKTIVRLEEKVLFESSKASMKASGLGVLKKVGEALQKIQGKHVQVQGHTDSRPIRWELQGKYPTNWELSASRASTIVRYLIEEVGADPTRLSAAGYAYFQPVASNDTPEGRQENRRVEFVLLPLR